MSCRAGSSLAPADPIRVGYSGDTDFGDLPSVLAHEALQAEGYRVDVTHLGAPDLMTDALARGRIDIAIGSVPSAWAAVARGAHVRTILGHAANPHRLVVSSAITSCAQLSGRRLALHGEGAVSTALVRAYIQEACPESKPVYLLMSESSSRSAALLAGGIDAAALEVSSLLWLDGQAPGRFRVLTDFSTRWPLIATTAVHVNLEYAAAHPGVVDAYVRQRLIANERASSDAGLLAATAARVIGQSPAWPVTAAAYAADRAWPAGGGLSDAVVARTLEFYQAHGALDRTLLPAMVADLQYVRRALARKP